MKGLFINENNSVVEGTGIRGDGLNLIARGDGSEVMLQSTKCGKTFAVSPGEERDLMEFFYLLEGSVKIKHNGMILNKGNHFYVHCLEEAVYLEAMEDTTILYVSSRPVFDLLSEEINKFTSILQSVADKDMCTYEHNYRLADYSVKIGKRLNLSDERLDVLYNAALFHDLGKINVPDEILKKSGRLTLEEFELIKKHPSYGKQIVADTYLSNISDIIEQHHERLNGTGYPHGLKGNQILIEAMIIAIVDSFDAMISERPYKKSMPIEAVMGELKSLCDVFYDKNLMDIFEKILIEENRL